MNKYIFPAIRLTSICIVFFSGVYTMIILVAAKISSSHGTGEKIVANGKTFYVNVGQKFTDDKYFYSRPSAVDYNAAAAGGSNKGPSNPEYLALVQARIDTFMVHNPGISRSQIPSDIVTASGSGLDPNISVKAAQIQIGRISRLRGIAEPNLEQLIISNTERPLLNLMGTEQINVLKINIALDNLK